MSLLRLLPSKADAEACRQKKVCPAHEREADFFCTLCRGVSVELLDYAEEAVGAEVEVSVEFVMYRFPYYDLGVLADVQGDSALDVGDVGVG